MAGVRQLLHILLWTVTFFSPFNRLGSQNLVANPGFESVTTCPIVAGQIDLAAPWQPENLTPDLYHRCSQNAIIRPPRLEIFCTYLEPHQGDGFAGMVVYGPVQEYLKAPLIESLKAGQQYFIRFWVAIDDNCIQGIPNVFSSGIGLAFGNSTTNYGAAVENESGILKDTSGWVEISGCYTAKGNESYVYLGNFRSNGSTMIEYDQEGTVYEDYMYVDDIEVIPFDPLPDTIWKCEDPVVLNGAFQELPVRWQDGSYSPSYQIDSAGFIQVTAETAHCLLTDESRVLDGIPDASASTGALCPGNSITLEAPVAESYLWQDGYTGRVNTVTLPGHYAVSFQTGCGTFDLTFEIEDHNCDCSIFIPNVFSPNGDGVNDDLKVSMNCKVSYTIVSFSVFDRWGQEIFRTQTPETTPWNGASAPGVYVYRLEYLVGNQSPSHVKFGDITIVR